MLRDPDAVAPARMTTPKQLVDQAIRHGAPVVASSYNEPLITSEWAVDVFKKRAAAAACAYISNGNGHAAGASTSSGRTPTPTRSTSRLQR